MGRDLTRGRTFPDNVARSIKAPLDGQTDGRMNGWRANRRGAARDGERTGVIKESRGELTSREAAQRKRLVAKRNLPGNAIRRRMPYRYIDVYNID